MSITKSEKTDSKQDNPEIDMALPVQATLRENIAEPGATKSIAESRKSRCVRLCSNISRPIEARSSSNSNELRHATPDNGKVSSKWPKLWAEGKGPRCKKSKAESADPDRANERIEVGKPSKACSSTKSNKPG